eukprot:TRINITY_DN24171_c0_g1_i1.p3 TRINITY_DN24171_c0_g1~~TRINITY_DN24171_c0_g1_i1.p3  ORF type:complete len:106 (-),score=16.69 TRINITY_DN24171_c0_g1_i1:936-1253(-)
MSSPSSDEPNLDSGERNNCTTIGTDLVDHAIFKSGSSMKRLSSRNASLFCSCSNTSVGALGSSQKLITFIIPECPQFFWFYSSLLELGGFLYKLISVNIPFESRT